LSDGHIWMVQDLKFGDKCGAKTTFSGSNGSDKTNGNYTSLPGTWYGDCRNNTQPGAGYLYDWAAAIQKSGAYRGGPDVGCSGTASGTAGKNPAACRGICPQGWHLPTGGANGEFKALYNKYPSGTCGSSNCYCWGPSTEFEGVLGGWCSNTGSFGYTGEHGLYYSSTVQSTTSAFSLFFLSSKSEPGTHYNETTKWYGHSVRCVKNY
jgi:uncharacterized protein (TIGR02145 family)